VATFSCPEKMDSVSYQKPFPNIISSKHTRFGSRAEIDSQIESEHEPILSIDTEDAFESGIESFVPSLLVEQVNRKGEGILGVSCLQRTGACLVMDISGFTALSRELSAKGASGLSELRDAVSGFLKSSAQVVEKFGGDIIFFAGDALICVFANDTNESAPGEIPVAYEPCAVILQAILCAFELKHLHVFGLRAHVGVSFGTFFITTLGGYQDKWTQVVSGPALEVSSQCVQIAGSSEAVVGACIISALQNYSGSDVVLQKLVHVFKWAPTDTPEEYFLMAGLDEMMCINLLLDLIAMPPRTFVPTIKSPNLRRTASITELLSKFVPTKVVHVLSPRPSHPVTRKKVFAMPSASGSFAEDDVEDYDDLWWADEHAEEIMTIHNTNTLSIDSRDEEIEFQAMVADSSIAHISPEEFERTRHTMSRAMQMRISTLINMSNSSDQDFNKTSLLMSKSSSHASLSRISKSSSSCSDCAPATASGELFFRGVTDVVTLFLKLDDYHIDPNVSPDSPPAAGVTHLQPLYLSMQESITRTGGYLRQFVVDDKGCVLVAFWGIAMVATSRTNSMTRSVYQKCIQALSSAVEIADAVKLNGYTCSISLTTGSAYCGAIGTATRQEYAAMGYCVNKCAKMMAASRDRSGETILVDRATARHLLEHCPQYEPSKESELDPFFSHAETWKLAVLSGSTFNCQKPLLLGKSLHTKYYCLLLNGSYYTSMSHENIKIHNVPTPSLHDAPIEDKNKELYCADEVALSADGCTDRNSMSDASDGFSYRHCRGSLGTSSRSDRSVCSLLSASSGPSFRGMSEHYMDMFQLPEDDNCDDSSSSDDRLPTIQEAHSSSIQSLASIKSLSSLKSISSSTNTPPDVDSPPSLVSQAQEDPRKKPIWHWSRQSSVELVWGKFFEASSVTLVDDNSSVSSHGSITKPSPPKKKSFFSRTRSFVSESAGSDSGSPLKIALERKTGSATTISWSLSTGDDAMCIPKEGPQSVFGVDANAIELFSTSSPFHSK
jgi:class 3 adenylate cyclase